MKVDVPNDEIRIILLDFNQLIFSLCQFRGLLITLASNYEDL